LSSGLTAASAQTNTPPVINILQPSPGVYLTTIPLSFMAGAFDAEDGALNNQIEWSSNVSGFIGTGSGIDGKLPPGDHTITAKVTDSGGLTSTDTVSGVIVFTSNVRPVMTINNPNTGDIFGKGEPITFVGSAIDDHDGDVSETIFWISDVDGDLEANTMTPDTVSVEVRPPESVTFAVIV